MIRILLLIAVAFCLTSATYAASGETTTFPDISHDELVKAIAAKQVVLLDANGTESYTQGHIPGAIDFDANKDKLADLLPKDKATLIVAYCGGPACTAYKAAAEDASKLGYTNVKHLKEGISGWKASGATVETATAPTAH